MKNSTIDRARAEAEAGRLWRAKEILAGSIGTQGYEPTRFAAYGRVLARMRDDKEAGKYLFLSGQATPDEAPVVETFLASVRGRPHRWIYTQFPGRVRRISLQDLPERVREGLLALGFPVGFKWLSPPAHQITPPGKVAAAGALVFGFTFVFVVAAGLIHGCGVVFDWISKW